ncbi:unnamed protein product, partial [Cyprideis torosa]
MAPVEKPAMATDASKEPVNTEETMSGKSIIGIIYPPPEVRNIVDKTASFVARNGPEFESRIRQNEINNPKFNFLNPGDPYNAYFKHKVKDFIEGKAAEPALSQTAPPGLRPMQHKAQQEILKQAVAEKEKDQIILKDPPVDWEFISDPPSIAAFDLDIVKLTAQFVARNGRQFLTNLMNREARNYQFDFLRPQHALFQYFTKLLEQYTKVLIPPKDLMKRLQDESNAQVKVLEDVRYSSDIIGVLCGGLLFEKFPRSFPVAYAQIDWHDFVVVETVDYQPWETGQFPGPTTPEEVGARVLMEERGGAAPPGEEDAVEMEEVGSPERDAPPPAQPPTPDQVIVKKGYDPKGNKLDRDLKRAPHRPAGPAGGTGEQYLISPLTGEKIPAHK